MATIQTAIQALFDYLDLYPLLKTVDTNNYLLHFQSQGYLSSVEVQVLSEIVSNHQYVKFLLDKGLTLDPTNEMLLMAKNGFDLFGSIPRKFYGFIYNVVSLL